MFGPRLLIPSLVPAIALSAGSKALGSDAEAITTPAPLAGHDIVYQWVQGDGDGIFLEASDGSGGGAILSDLEGSTWHPDWSPDGSRIAFEREHEDGWDIWTAAADGSDPRSLSTPPFAQSGNVSACRPRPGRRTDSRWPMCGSP